MCCCVLAGSPYAPAAKKKKKAKRPPLRRSAQRRERRRRQKVDGYLEDSAAKAFQQPGALVPFFEQLVRLGTADNKTPVHIIQFGDSHTAADEWTGGLRDQFRERFGDGGSGFSLAGHPFVGYRRFDARGGGTHGVGERGAAHGLGRWLVRTGRGQHLHVARRPVCLSADRVRPLGDPLSGATRRRTAGTLRLRRKAGRDSDRRGNCARASSATSRSPARTAFLLKTLDARPVRLFGWVADKAAGVTYEALGINGAEATLLLEVGRKHAGHLLATPESGTDCALLRHQRSERSAVASRKLSRGVRESDRAAAAGRAGGEHPGARAGRPVDCRRAGAGNWWRGSTTSSRSSRACARNWAAFTGTRASGWAAPGTMRDWQTAGLAQGDRVHFTAAGYRRLATVLYSDLMQLFEAYKKARPETGEQISHDRPKPNR